MTLATFVCGTYSRTTLYKKTNVQMFLNARKYDITRNGNMQ